MSKKNMTGYPNIDKPWLKYYPKTTDTETKGGLYDYLKVSNINNMDSVAISYFGHKFTFKKYFELIDRLSMIFLENGVKSGEKVVILGLNTPEIIGSVYALNKIGAVCCIESVIQLEASLNNMIKKYEAKYVVVLDIVYEKYMSVLENSVDKIFMTKISDSMPVVTKTIANLKSKKYDDKRIIPMWKFSKKFQENAFDWNPGDTAILLSTSGSTGVPKRAELSNGSINALAAQSRYVDLDLKPGRSMLSPAPPFLAYGISLTIHLPLCNGMCVILSPNPDPNFVAKQFIKYKPNTFIGGRVFLDKIMQYDKDMSFVSAIEIGGEAVAIEYIELFEDYLRSHNSKGKVLTGYGMTELSGCSTTESISEIRRGSVGIPLCDVNMKVLDIENKQELKYGESGELYISSPCLMNQYYMNDEETNKVISIDSDGNRWIQTGDIAKIDSDGFVYIVGRIKRIAVTVDPKDNTHIKIFLDYIEQQVNNLEYIARGAVVAIEDEKRMSIPVAFVELSNVIGEVENHIKADLKGKLEDYNIPQKIYVVDEIPVLTNGKIDFKKLEEMANEEGKIKYEPELLLEFMSLYLDEWKHRDEIMWPQMFRFYSASLVVSLLPYMDKLIGIEEIPKWIFHILGLIMSIFCAFIMWSYGCKLQASSDTYNQLIDKVDIEICKRKKVEDTCRGRLGKSLLKIPLAKCIPSFLFASLVLINIVFLIIEFI